MKNIEDEQLLKKIENPQDFPIVYHVFLIILGNLFKAWEMIKKSGLNKMGRNHVHFTTG